MTLRALAIRAILAVGLSVAAPRVAAASIFDGMPHPASAYRFDGNLPVVGYRPTCQPPSAGGTLGCGTGFLMLIGAVVDDDGSRIWAANTFSPYHGWWSWPMRLSFEFEVPQPAPNDPTYNLWWWAGVVGPDPYSSVLPIAMVEPGFTTLDAVPRLNGVWWDMLSCDWSYWNCDLSYGGSDASGFVAFVAPEPTSLALLGTGVVGIGLVARRRRKAV